MRTTLTIDDDVAAALERLQKASDASMKQLINEALRRGIREMNEKPKRREQFRTRAVDLGRLRVSTIDDIGEALAMAEGERFK
jgi:hypothetical protein